MATHRKTGKALTSREGSYRRTLGRFVNAAGKVGPKKFLLGRDRRKAEAANARLELLWEVVQEHHARRQAALPFTAPPSPDTGPLWQGLELELAEAVRQGHTTFVVGPGDLTTHTPAGYATRLHWLTETYGHLIRFTAALPDDLLQGQAHHADAARHRVRQATHNSAVAKVKLPAAAGSTLYAAVDAYADHAARQAKPAHAKRARDQVERIKQATPDLPLDLVNYEAIQRIGDHWRSRPPTQRPGGKSAPIAIDTVIGNLKCAKRFFKWLDRQDSFQWERPRDFEEALSANVRKLRTEQERSELAQGPDTWTVDELATLYRYATDRERCLILLGLNFGFAQEEILTLRSAEIDRTGSRPILKRIRHKSEVYHEAAAWPETVRAIDWLEREQKRLGSGGDGLVWLTEKGSRPTSQHLANTWNKLRKRVNVNVPGFTALYSFKHLRKTAGQLVREVADGETAGVFLAHGTPVSSDNLLDVYTRRIFDRVFAANDAAHHRLAPMFAAAPDAFSEPRSKGSNNIPQATINLIRRLWADGVTPAEIVRTTKVSRPTVYRHRPAIAA